MSSFPLSIDGNHPVTLVELADNETLIRYSAAAGAGGGTFEWYVDELVEIIELSINLKASTAAGQTGEAAVTIVTPNVAGAYGIILDRNVDYDSGLKWVQENKKTNVVVKAGSNIKVYLIGSAFTAYLTMRVRKLGNGIVLNSPSAVTTLRSCGLLDWFNGRCVTHGE